MLSVTSTQLQTWLSLFLLPMLRYLGLLITLPVLGHRALPIRVRVGLAMALALVVSPTLAPIHTQLDGPNLVALVAQQLFIGLGMGFAVRLSFAAVELAGELIGLQLGLGFSQFIDPQTSRQQPILGSFLMLLASWIFLSIDAHLTMIETLAASFVTMPINPGPAGFPGSEDLMRFGGLIFLHGLQLSLPIIAALLITNLAIGILARTAPSLNLMSVGFPLTMAVGFWVLITALPNLTSAMERMLVVR